MTLLQIRVLQFFQSHPRAVETVRGMSVWVGAPPSAIEEALQELVHRRWLTLHETASVAGYALTDDEGLLAQMEGELKEAAD